MQDAFTSTNDPLFFLHHAGIDHLWATWQELDVKNRLNDIFEPVFNSSRPLFPGFKPPPPLSPETPVVVGFAAPNRPVKDFLDTMNRDGQGFLCYKYDRGTDIIL
jgi:tyrosinase